MECRNCDFWTYGEGEAAGAGMCKGSGSPNYGWWTCPDDGCVDTNGDMGCVPMVDEVMLEPNFYDYFYYLYI